MTYGALSERSGGVNWDEDPRDDEEDKEDVCLYQPMCIRKMPTREERAWPTSTTSVSRTIPRVTQPPNVMKPVPLESKRYIYQGLSHDGEGRALYLKHRYELSPDEKFHFPICSSWEYGWNYARNIPSNCPRHGSL
ncbi:hypothetical protein X975_04615, partial [Stegodyphus mimosarum]